MTTWTPAAVADLINDIGNWTAGMIILWAIVSGFRTAWTGK